MLPITYLLSQSLFDFRFESAFILGISAVQEKYAAKENSVFALLDIIITCKICLYVTDQ